MIDQYQEIALLEKPVLQRVIFKPPLKAKQEMVGESCFIYPLQGQATVHGGGERRQIKTNEGVLMKCGRYLNLWRANEDDSVNEVVVMHLFADILQYVYDNSIPDFLVKQQPQSVKCIQVVKYNEALKNYIQGLRFYFDHPQLLDDTLTKLKLKELIFLLYKSGNPAIRLLLQELFEEEKVSLRDLVNKHIFDPLSVEDLAYLSHLSLSSFKRKFKAIFQTSPAKYIRTKRLEKAVDLLRYSDKRIADIGYDCGFNDPKVFAKSFKAHFSISPSELRKIKLEPN